MLESSTYEKIGLPVTRLSLGALPMGPLQKNISPEDGARVVRAALENGINFIDTATAYRTYEHIRKGLAGWTGDVIIATKTHAKNDRKTAEEHIVKALRKLGRDVIDIMLCHCGRTFYSDEEWGPTLDALLNAREKGLIKMVGVSSHSVEGVRIAARHKDIEVIHPLINMYGMGIIDGSAEDMLDAIREAYSKGMFTYAMKSLAGGNYIPEREKALRWIFNIPEIHSVAVGMVKESEVEWNVRFASGKSISADLSRKTAKNSKKLSIVPLACAGCGDCIEHCENMALYLDNGKARVREEDCILCGYCSQYCKMFAIRMA